MCREKDLADRRRGDKMKLKQVKTGEWVQPIRRGYRMACCDCGLIHHMDFRIYRGRVQMRGFRDRKEWQAANRKGGR